jgi:TolB protein
MHLHCSRWRRYTPTLLAIIALASAACGDAVQAPSDDDSVGPAPHVPDGRLAFVSFREGDQEIFVKDLPEGEEQNLTGDPADDFDPDISEDGEKIAFVSLRDGQAQVFTMPSGGGDAVQVTDGREGAQTPRWSRDGKRIAFSRAGAVAVVNEDGSGLEVLVDPAPEGAGEPCRYGAFIGGWSPDDSEIIYYSARVDEEEGQICLVTSDGGEPEVVLDEEDASLVEPVISPDGTKIVYRAIVAGQHDIWVLDRESGEQTNLTDDPDLDIEPDWSPDGRWIAYGALRPDAPFFDLYLVQADGSGVTRVTTDPAKEANPVWGPAPH